MGAPRVLLAKPGLDGHDRGVKVVAMALRDAGAEVVYLGLRRSAGQIVGAAAEEDVDVIGLSVLSGAHMPLCRDILDELSRQGLDEVPLVIGGTIPADDAQQLRDWGVTAVYPVGSGVDEVVAGVLELARSKDPS